MDISIIVPVLDEAARIAACLDHLMPQGFGEIIVVDGRSSDGTTAIVSRYPGVTLIEGPRGRSVQMNEGARQARGQILMFLHADVRLPADAPMHVNRVMREPTNVAGAFRTLTVVDDGSPPPWWSPLLRLADLRSHYSRLPYGDQALFVRRRAFLEVGGFPEIPLMEDLELSCRLRHTGTIRIAPARVTVSGRRFLRRPVFHFLLMNSLPLLYRLRVPPRLLARVYPTIR